MNTIFKIALAATVVIFAQNVNAQEAQQEVSQKIVDQVSTLEARKEKVKENWKSNLKQRIQFINAQREKQNISATQAEQQKKDAAQEVALNIENELAIIDNQIALVKRTGRIDPSKGTSVEIGFGSADENGNRVLGIAVNTNKPKKVTYDRRTYSELVFAFGLNNGIVENGADFGDEFSIGKSRFFELGYAWKTRVFQNSGALHLKYGVSLQTNKLFTKQNERLVVTDGIAAYEEFPQELDKSQLRFSNLVVPVHLEFGGWKKEQEEDYVRYRLSGKFRMGIGGYVGVRLGTQQKLKYKINGDRIKTKEKQDFGGDNFVYGVSSYIRLSQDLSLYGKYDLSTAFSTSDLGDVNNVSLGLRWDW